MQFNLISVFKSGNWDGNSTDTRTVHLHFKISVPSLAHINNELLNLSKQTQATRFGITLCCVQRPLVQRVMISKSFVFHFHHWFCRHLFVIIIYKLFLFNIVWTVFCWTGNGSVRASDRQ